MIRRIVAGAVLAGVCLLLVSSGAAAGEKTRLVRVYAPEADEKEYKVVIESDDDDAWLGVGIMSSEEYAKQAEKGELKLPKGVFVTEVYEDSPAERAGLQDGDVIVGFDSKKTSDVDDLIDLIDEKKPGEEVEITIVRDGSEQILVARLGSRPEEILMAGPFTAGLEGLRSLAILGDLALPWFEIGLSGGGRGRLGVYIDDMSEGLAEYFEVPEGKGVLVEDIVEESPAERAGIKAGDVIIKVGDMRVVDRASLVEAISEMEADVETPVVIIRKGREMTLVAVVGESEYDKAIKEYEKALEMHAEDLKEARAKGLLLDEDIREEMEDELEELKEELKELKEELRELKED